MSDTDRSSRFEKQDSRSRNLLCGSTRVPPLYDDNSDGKSAILVVRVNGEERPPWFNSRHHAERSPDGHVIIKPPMSIPVSFSTNDTVDFRVCAADRSRDYKYPEETCGDWTRIWPRG